MKTSFSAKIPFTFLSCLLIKHGLSVDLFQVRGFLKVFLLSFVVAYVDENAII